MGGAPSPFGGLLVIAALAAPAVVVGCGDDPTCPDGLVPSDGRCVPAACGACSAPTPFCDPDAARCVECLGDPDCEGSAAGPLCASGRCVECLSGGFCNDPAAPICRDDRCDACANFESCGPFGWCDADGVCGECQPEVEDVACEGTACDPVDRRCGDRPLGSQAACEPCIASSECGNGRRCVAMRFGGDPVGSFCLDPAGSDADCVDDFVRSVVPLAVREGETDFFCVPFDDAFTCPAYLDGLRRAPCVTPDECGVEDLADGRCPDGICTVACRVDGPTACLGDGTCPADGLCVKPAD